MCAGCFGGPRFAFTGQCITGESLPYMKNYIGEARQSGGGRGRARPEPPQAAQGGSAAKPRCTFVSLRETKDARPPRRFRRGVGERSRDSGGAHDEGSSKCGMAAFVGEGEASRRLKAAAFAPYHPSARLLKGLVSPSLREAPSSPLRRRPPRLSPSCHFTKVRLTPLPAPCARRFASRTSADAADAASAVGIALRSSAIPAHTR